MRSTASSIDDLAGRQRRGRGRRRRRRRARHASATPIGASASPRSPSRSRRGPRWSPSRRASSRSTIPSVSPAARCAICWPTPAATRSTGTEPIARPARTADLLQHRHRDGRRARSPSAAGMPFADYLGEAVLDPLGMTGDRARGLAGPRHLEHARRCRSVRSTKLQRPAPRPRDDRRRCPLGRSVPELAGIVPGVGRFDPCPWGLGFEIRGDKAPHWTGTANIAAHVRPLRRCRYVDVGGPGRRLRAASRSPTARSTSGRPRPCSRWPRARRCRARGGRPPDDVRPVTVSGGTTTDDDGLPLVRYGFVGGVAERAGPVMVMLDGELERRRHRPRAAAAGDDHQRRAAAGRRRPASTTRRCAAAWSACGRPRPSRPASTSMVWNASAPATAARPGLVAGVARQRRRALRRAAPDAITADPRSC